MNEKPTAPAQELFFEVIWTSDMTDADKARWLYESAKTYWEQLEGIRDALTPLRLLWITALAYKGEDAVLWRDRDMFGEVVLTVDDIRRPLHAANPHLGTWTDEQIASSLAEAIVKVRRPTRAAGTED